VSRSRDTCSPQNRQPNPSYRISDRKNRQGRRLSLNFTYFVNPREEAPTTNSSLKSTEQPCVRAAAKELLPAHGSQGCTNAFTTSSLGRAFEDVRIKNAAVAPTIVVDRRSERSPSQLDYCSYLRSILSTTPSMLAALNLRACTSFTHDHLFPW
jgi:hypothetical protein